MNKKRVYSHHCQEAAQLLGHLIQAARKEKQMTTIELAERTGISRGTLHKIEQGSLTCELGIVFEVAMIVGVQLFDMEPNSLQAAATRTQNQLTLLPQRVRRTRGDFYDDF